MVDDEVRRRRAERVREAQRQARPQKLMKNVKVTALVLVGILALGGAVYGYTQLPDPPARVHWHAKYQIVVDNETVSFHDPEIYDMRRYHDAHLHPPDQDIIHNEGREGRGNLAGFVKFTLGGDLTPAKLVLPPGSSKPGTYVEEDGNKVQIFVNNTEEGKPWTEISNPEEYSFRNYDRILILYGNYTDEELRALQENFPPYGEGIGEPSDVQPADHPQG